MGGASEVVLRALEAHDRALDAHLDIEEEAVIPLLLALEPEEFVRYYDSPISLLIPGRGSHGERCLPKQRGAR